MSERMTASWDLIEEWLVLRTLVAQGKGDDKTKARLLILDKIISKKGKDNNG